MSTDTERLYPFSGVDDTRITEAGFEIPRQEGDSATLTWDEISDEWKFSRGTLKLITKPNKGNDTSQVLIRNSNTGEVEQVSSGDLVDAGIDVVGGDDITTSYNSSSDKYTISLKNEIDVNLLTLDQNNTKNTSGDIQIRDSSTGELFSLNDGNSPQLQVKYEGNGAFTFGSRNKTNGVGNDSVSIGFNSESSGLNSIGIGRNVISSGHVSTNVGLETISRSYGGNVVGIWNEDYVGSGNETTTLKNVSDDERIFSVGVGEDPNSSQNDNDYIDGRGRVDGIYVTLRNGTHVRHGISIDGYNASLGKYETVFEIDERGNILKGSVSNLNPPGPDRSIQFNDDNKFNGEQELLWTGSGIRQSSGSLVVENDNSEVKYSLNQKTSGNTKKLLKVDSQGKNILPTVPDEGTWYFQGNVTARVVSSNSSLSDSTNGDSHVWKVKGVISQKIDNDSTGSTSIRFIGAPSITTVATDVSVNNYNVDILINSDGELKVEVQGEVGDEVHWLGNLEVDEIIG